MIDTGFDQLIDVSDQFLGKFHRDKLQEINPVIEVKWPFPFDMMNKRFGLVLRKRIYPKVAQGFSTIMGGAKKRSMAQMEKTQDQPDKGKDESPTPGKKGGKTKTVAEKRARGLQAPDLNDPKFIGEVGKMSAITPYSLASQFNVKLSVAKDLLEELERRKMVTLVGGNARIRIYQPAAA